MSRANTIVSINKADNPFGIPAIIIFNARGRPRGISDNPDAQQGRKLAREFTGTRATQVQDSALLKLRG